MRPLAALMPLALAACATTDGAVDERDAYHCSAEVRSDPARATSTREVSLRGQPREVRTSVETSFPGTPPVQMSAEWDRPDLPEVAEGRYFFTMVRTDPTAEPAQLQLLLAGQPIARSGWSGGRVQPGIEVRGRDLGPAWLGGAPISLRLVARDNRVLATTALPREGLDRAMELARQANASVLAKSTDYRRQCEASRVITAA